MRVYLAGPMSGIPAFNFPAFERAAKWLRSQGHDVFSPAEQDIAEHGVEFGADNLTGDQTLAKTLQGFNLRRALWDDLRDICARAEAIAVLPGWEKSKGVAAELATARALDLVEIYVPRHIAEGTDPWPQM